MKRPLDGHRYPGAENALESLENATRSSSLSLFRVRAIIQAGKAPESRSVVFQPTFHRPI